MTIVSESITAFIKSYNQTMDLFQEDPVNSFFPVFFGFIFLEFLIQLKLKKKDFYFKDSLVSIFLFGLTTITLMFWKYLFFHIFYYIYQNHSLFHWNQNLSYFLLLFLMDDFSFYWAHRAMHRVRFFWAAHVVHHSSEYMNFGSALRQSIWEDLVKNIFWLWIPFLGFHPLTIMIATNLNLTYQFFLHTKLVKKLGFLEKILNTPSHHRVHHGSNPIYIDKNYAGVLIIWDKLFGSFQEESEEVKYGITEKINSYNPFVVLNWEYRKIISFFKLQKPFIEKWNYLWNPPG